MNSFCTRTELSEAGHIEVISAK